MREHDTRFKAPRRPLGLCGCLSIVAAIILIRLGFWLIPPIWSAANPWARAQLKEEMSPVLPSTAITGALASGELGDSIMNSLAKEQLPPLLSGADLLNAFNKRKRELYRANDPKLVGYSIDEFVWDYRYEQFKNAQADNPELTYKEFLWQQWRILNPERTRREFERVTSFAETYDDYRYDTDMAYRLAVDEGREDARR